MIYILGHQVEETTERMCRRSHDDHVTLKHEARAARQAGSFNVDDSYVLCGKCGLVISLRI